MSEESRQHADNAKRHLKSAETSLQHAKENAGSAKDPALVKQIERVQTDVKTIKESVEKKLDPKQG